MKRMNVIAFLELASTLGLGSASAQMQSRQVHATVPFDFTVANKQLPAGNVFHRSGKGRHHSDFESQGDPSGDDSGIRERQPVEGMRPEF